MAVAQWLPRPLPLSRCFSPLSRSSRPCFFGHFPALPSRLPRPPSEHCSPLQPASGGQSAMHPGCIGRGRAPSWWPGGATALGGGGRGEGGRDQCGKAYSPCPHRHHAGTPSGRSRLAAAVVGGVTEARPPRPSRPPRPCAAWSPAEASGASGQEGRGREPTPAADPAPAPGRAHIDSRGWGAWGPRAGLGARGLGELRASRVSRHKA